MIIHILADGRVVNSIEGHVVPYNEKTRIAYQMLAEVVLNEARNTADHNDHDNDKIRDVDHSRSR